MTTTTVRRRKSPRGEPLNFLLGVVASMPDSCVLWPYNTYGKGYGKLRFQGAPTGAHRVACILAHGAPPSSKHQAAHRCGVRNCVNPQHIRWATPAENELDKVAHGSSNRGERHGLARLSAQAVQEIRAASKAESNPALAGRFGVSEKTIRRILSGETWSWLP